MPTLVVDGLTFEFPSHFRAGKYDDWSFYRHRFSRMWNGIKSVDILAVDPQSRTLWLVEVKDYRNHRRTKPTELAEEICHKVFDSLAALLPAKTGATVAEERQLAQAGLAASKLRVVLHLEQPAKSSALRPRAIDAAILKQELRRRLKPIDPHPLVAERAQMASLPWTVSLEGREDRQD